MRNKPARPFWIAEIKVPGGSQEVLIDPANAPAFNADPDTGAASYFGLTKIEYLQWIDLDGTPLCGHRTRAGDLCRNAIGRSQMRSDKWLDHHRKGLCAAHSRVVSKKRP